MARRPVEYDILQDKLVAQPASPLLEFAKQANLPKAKRKKSIINTTTRGDEEAQRIATPWAFIHALEQRFGTPVDFDLACDVGNAKAGNYFADPIWHPGDGVDSLTQDWSDLWQRHPAGDLVPIRLAYLNPPYANIRPWAHGPKDNPKAGLAACRWLKRWTVMLVPASYSTDWFLELRGKVQIDAIPRIQFEGATHLYPKDLCLCIAGFGVSGEGYWDWRISYLQSCIARGVDPERTHLKGITKLAGVAPILPDFHWSPDPFLAPVLL